MVAGLERNENVPFSCLESILAFSLQGEKGQEGKRGSDGHSGPQGAPGLQGPPGPPGEQGPTVSFPPSISTPNMQSWALTNIFR